MDRKGQGKWLAINYVFLLNCFEEMSLTVQQSTVIIASSEMTLKHYEYSFLTNLTECFYLL